MPLKNTQPLFEKNNFKVEYENNSKYRPILDKLLYFNDDRYKETILKIFSIDNPETALVERSFPIAH